MIQMNLSMKQKQTHRCRDQIYNYQRSKVEREFRSWRLTEANYYIKLINDKVLLYRTVFNVL